MKIRDLIQELTDTVGFRKGPAAVRCLCSTLPLLIGSSFSVAENVQDAARILCAPTTIRICFETGDCFPALPDQLAVPEFFVIDTVERTIHTTPASDVDRRSEFSAYSRANGVLMLQGSEAGRAFSMLVHEQTGLLSASITQDGFAVASFGRCTVHD